MSRTNDEVPDSALDIFFESPVDDWIETIREDQQDHDTDGTSRYRIVRNHGPFKYNFRVNNCSFRKDAAFYYYHYSEKRVAGLMYWIAKDGFYAPLDEPEAVEVANEVLDLLFECLDEIYSRAYMWFLAKHRGGITKERFLDSEYQDVNGDLHDWSREMVDDLYAFPGEWSDMVLDRFTELITKLREE